MCGVLKTHALTHLRNEKFSPDNYLLSSECRRTPFHIHSTRLAKPTLYIEAKLIYSIFMSINYLPLPYRQLTSLTGLEGEGSLGKQHFSAFLKATSANFYAVNLSPAEFQGEG